MDFIDNLDNNSLLIIPNGMKDSILQYINSLDKLLNVKIITFNELKKELLFDISDESILFLMNKYNLKKSVIEDYLRNIYYIDNKKYKSDKLNLLVDILISLKDNNLLIHDDLLLKEFKNKKVYVYGYDYIDKFNNKLLSNFNNVEIIKEKTIRESITINSLNTLEDEVLYLLENITSLIDNNIPLENIIITNVDDDYKREIYKYFNMSSIPVEIYKGESLSSSIIGKKVLSLLKENNSLEDTLSYIENNYDMENISINKIYSKILNIFNRYNPYKENYPNRIIYECIEDDFNKEKIILNRINGIRIEDYSDRVFSKDEYVFFVNFNEGVVPLVHKDEAYITDKMKEELDMDKTYQINLYEKESLINKLLNTPNIYVSYKSRYKDEEYYKSSLIDNKTLIDNKYEINKNTTYSSLYTKLLLSSKIDDLIKYGKHDEYLDILNNTIDTNYREFDNRYKPINKEELKEYLNNKINISYSTLNTFYNCSFRYYLDNILRINSFTESFDTIVGSLFHFVLSKLYEDNFDLDREWNYYLKDKELTPKEKFYINKLKKELEIIVEYIQEFDKETGLTLHKTEELLDIPKPSNLNVTFKGFVDKIMYKEYDGDTLVSIIDYKTGNQDVDLRDTDYGMSMQLPVYLYLVEKKNIFDRYKPVGLYLQKILSKEVDIDENLSYKEQKYKNLKLHGYSTDNLTNLSRFDPTYEDSKYIQSMKTTKNGFYAYTKILTEDEMKELINLVDNKVDDMIRDIEEAKFDINPKEFDTDKEVTGCKFCSYKDICFRTNKDIKELKKHNDLSFLDNYK